MVNINHRETKREKEDDDEENVEKKETEKH